MTYGKRVAIVFGASRGLGASTAIELARAGFYVTVCSKSTTEKGEGLRSGTIFSVAKKIEELGSLALPIACDVRSEDQIRHVIQQTLEHFKGRGTLDTIVYNAGALLHSHVSNTTLKQYELLHAVNARGCFVAATESLPHLLALGPDYPHVPKFIIVSSPIYSRFFRGKTPYAMTKVAMTVLMHGLAMELKDTRVATCTIWPATPVESAATENLLTGGMTNLLRKVDIFGDAITQIALDQDHTYVNGKALIDEDYLRERWGWTDFKKYQFGDVEVPRMMPKKFPSLKVEEEDFEYLSAENLQKQAKGAKL